MGKEGMAPLLAGTRMQRAVSYKAVLFAVDIEPHGPTSSRSAQDRRPVQGSMQPQDHPGADAAGTQIEGRIFMRATPSMQEFPPKTTFDHARL